MPLDSASRKALAQFIAELRTLIQQNEFLRTSLNAFLARGGSVFDWVRQPEVQMNLVKVGGMGLLFAGAASVPFLAAGFGLAGPTAGTLAPWLQSMLYGGATPAGGWFAAMTSAGMTGVLGTIHAATAATAGAGGAAWQYVRGVRP